MNAPASMGSAGRTVAGAGRGYGMMEAYGKERKGLSEVQPKILENTALRSIELTL